MPTISVTTLGRRCLSVSVPEPGGFNMLPMILVEMIAVRLAFVDQWNLARRTLDEVLVRACRVQEPKNATNRGVACLGIVDLVNEIRTGATAMAVFAATRGVDSPDLVNAAAETIRGELGSSAIVELYRISSRFAVDEEGDGAGRPWNVAPQ